jgi:ABC-type phosphate transport system substrate-binding protein
VAGLSGSWFSHFTPYPLPLTFHWVLSMTRTAFILCGLIVALLQSSAGLAADEPIVVVVNKKNPINSLNLRDLARLYNGEVTEWPSGESAVIINRSFESEIRAQYYRLVLNAKPTQKYFQTGSPIPFETMRVESDGAVARFVARIPWAVAYCYLSSADASVKILKIEGRSPTDPEYPLR